MSAGRITTTDHLAGTVTTHAAVEWLADCLTLVYTVAWHHIRDADPHARLAIWGTAQRGGVRATRGFAETTATWVTWEPAADR